MNVTYSKQFIKDIKKYPDLKKKILGIINTFKNANSLTEIKNIKKLKFPGNFFRIKIGSFRIGFSFANDTITFRRFLHRKDIYKYFP